MEMTRELFDYLARAAQGDESECPPAIDVVWHACLAQPQAYEAMCLETFGAVVEHVVNRPGERHANIQGPCHARLRLQ
jgi:hypothetical protein